MQLLSLEAQNIFSLGNVRLDLANRGLVLVTGYSEDELDSNGSGKSSIANKAIVWGLYGRTANGLRGDSVANRHTAGEAFVEISFIGTDSNTYRIRRSRRPRNLRLWRVQGSNSVELGGTSLSQTQETINKFLGRDYETFAQTCLFGQGKQETFAALSATNQKQLLDSILPLHRLSQWWDESKLRIDMETNRLATDQEKLKTGQRKLMELHALRETAMKDHQAFEENRQNSIRELEANLSSIQPELDRIAKIKRDGAAAIAEYQKKVPEYEALVKEREVLDAARSTKTKQLIQAQSTETLLRSRAKEIEERWRSVNKDCYACKRPFLDVLEYEETKKQLAEELRGIVSLVQTEEQRIGEIKAAITALMGQELLLNAQIGDIEKNFKAITELKAYLQTLDQKDMSASIDAHKEQIRLLREQENPHKNIVEQLTGLIDETERGAQELSENVIMAKAGLEAAKWWEKVFGVNMKIDLLKDAGQYLSDRASYHLMRLDNGQLRVVFNTVKKMSTGDWKDEFTLSIVSSTGGESFDSLSGGEQQLVGFAVGLALADLAELKVINRSNVMILDEPLENLGHKNSEALISYLTSLAKNRTILFISNDESLKDLIANRIEVRKSAGITRLC